MSLQTPPMISGLPLVGNMVEFMKDKIALIERGYQQHGEIFGFRLAGQNFAMLLGPENAEQFFAMTDKELSMKESMGYLEPVLGKVGILGGFEKYMEERKIIAPLLGGRYMKEHVATMVLETETWMEQAGEAGEFDINDFCQHITMYVASRALLGDEFRQHVGHEFVEAFHMLANGIDQVLPANLPLPRFRKRDQARKQLAVLLGDLIDERRANPENYDDFFQEIVNAELPDGSQFDKERLISLVILMVFAGFDTTSGHLAWAIVYLLEHPDFLEIVMQEIETVYATTDTLELKHLREMPHLGYAVTEVERYRPAVQVLMRTVKEDIEIGGYHIPAGWSVMLSPEFSHKLERVFTNPDQFDPERFNDERCEHAQHANTLTGFGGGLHKCWGMKFANNEIAIIVAMLLHKYDLQLSNAAEPLWISGMMRPNVSIKYQARVPQTELA
ncbi:MAG: cytochrome P450 [Chloroflexota bacterium]